MVNLAYKTLGEFNQTGATGILTYVADIEPLFIPLTLVAFFVVALLGSYFAQQRSSGKEDFMGSFAVAGYLTAIVAIIMSLIPNLINSITMAVTIIVAVIGTVFLMINKD